MQTIKQLLGTDGVTLENLKKTSQNAPLGKEWVRIIIIEIPVISLISYLIHRVHFDVDSLP